MSKICLSADFQKFAKNRKIIQLTPFYVCKEVLPICTAIPSFRMICSTILKISFKKGENVQNMPKFRHSKIRQKQENRPTDSTLGVQVMMVRMYAHTKFQDDLLNHVENFSQKLKKMSKICLNSDFQKFAKNRKMVQQTPFSVCR